MKFSYNLLKQFVDIKLSPQKLGELLTQCAFEVENVYKVGEEYENIFVAKVLSVEKHPNADRLRVVKLVINDKIISPVVCGAFNFSVGDMVALALPGAKIAQNIHSEKHESFVLEKTTIRGVESHGMICAEFELGLSTAPGLGILLLSKSLKPGTKLYEALKIPPKNYILNIALPANRFDVHSHIGIAREIAAITNKKIKQPSAKAFFAPAKKWKVNVNEKKLCPAYFGARFSVSVRQSPNELKNIVETLGFRSINTIVDITNLVMVELGNPTHAFDAAKVEGNITVKMAKDGEQFEAINHKTYKLDSSMLVVADEKKTLLLGGIIGGKESEISENTKEIILEVANFDPKLVRSASKKLNLKTDGSKIWEKGVHPSLVPVAFARCEELLIKYCDAKIIETTSFKASIPKPAIIKFKANDINKLLGINLSAKQIKSYLERFCIKLQATSYKLQATPPWWRADITSMPDLAEEVLKLYGYNLVKPVPLSASAENEAAKQSSFTNDIYETKTFFARLGYTEVQNYNFVSEKDILKFGAQTNDHVEIQNPLSEDQRYLKKYPLIPILKNINLNQKYFYEFKLFEIGKQYFAYENEPWVILAGNFSKHSKAEKLLAFTKFDILQFLNSFGMDDIKFEPDDKAPWLHIKINNANVGGIGILDKLLAKNFNIEGNFVFAKLQPEKIFTNKRDILFKTINKFPKVKRDISIIVDQKIKWSQIENIILSESDLLVGIDLFEASFLAAQKESQKFHYDFAKLGKKNFGITLVFRAKNRTLIETEVVGILNKIVVKLKQEINAELR